MQHPHAVTTAPPGRGQIEPAALTLLARHSAGLLATARRYSMTPEDAEDAYQRGVEILLTKAPTTHERELLPWLRTVVKHEAFAVRKSRGRSMLSEHAFDADSVPAWSDERAERYERLRLGAEAMAGLKPQEIRCLLLKAEGLSYKEICQATGWSYTKVNRALTEGRRAFLQRVARIESGEECRRLAPLISKVADGEASAAEMRRLRPHLKGCLACKATLREYRATPSRLAGLVPPVAALAGGGSGDGPAGFAARVLQAIQERAGELAGVKAATVAATAAVLAGGGVASVSGGHHDPPPVPASAFAEPAARPTTLAETKTASSPRPPASMLAPPNASATPIAASPTRSRGTRAGDPAPSAQPEFDPGTGTPPAASPASEQLASPPASEPAVSPPTTSTPPRSAPAGRPEFGP